MSLKNERTVGKQRKRPQIVVDITILRRWYPFFLPSNPLFAHFNHGDTPLSISLRFASHRQPVRMIRCDFGARERERLWSQNESVLTYASLI